MNLIFGMPLERTIQYHRMIAYVAITWAWLHFIFIIQYWIEEEAFDDIIEEEHNISGLIMLGSVSCIYLFTLNWVRRHHWEFFLKSHWILFSIFLWAAWKHENGFSQQVWC